MAVEHDPVKAAVEELAGLEETLRVLNILTRAAERKASESEAAHNALLKARATIGAVVEAQQAKVLTLRTAAERAANSKGATPA